MIDDDDKLTFYYCTKKKKTYPAYQLISHFLVQKEHDLVHKYNEFLIDIYLLLDNKKSKEIAIDWDNTISADKPLFKQLILKLQNSGFKPCICTLRAPDIEDREEIYGFLEELQIPIYFTDGKPKRRYLKKLGISIHIWIDDFYPGISLDSCKLLERNCIS